MVKMINRFMYALFLGYYMMKLKVPGFVLYYVRNNRPQVDSKNVWLALICLRNSPGLDESGDENLREMIKAVL